MPPCLGIYYVLPGCGLVVRRSPLTGPLAQVGNLQVSQESHNLWWKDLRKENGSYKDLPFDHFPRGRVERDMKENLFIVYIDPCVTGDEKLRAGILEQFGLSKEAVRWIDKYWHYRCAKCQVAPLRP